MAERFFLHGGAYHAAPTTRALPNGAIEVPRLPLEGEHWDAATGAFVTDHAIVADMAVPPGHIDTAHIIKATQAALVLSGATLTHGLLAEEAAALGISITSLAAQVEAQDQAFRAAEIARRVKKATGI